ncbi:MAG: bifunctional molybdenum cofactor guanylyltransferase MobA/molybdopterin-guanine dinucleotide biosynthesis adaptor protein MobB [Candidatus Sericytochromatia bacterium]
MGLKLKQDYLFNPYEIFFCGFSNSGKTTLIEKLVKKLAPNYSIGYAKHDAHFFEMDKEGKDSNLIYKAGVKQIIINDKDHFALISKNNDELVFNQKNFIPYDFVFVEGYKYNNYPKIVLIDKEKKILDDYKEGKITNVLAFVGEKEFNSNIHFFNRNDIDNISSFIINYFESLKPELYGLILVGGKSSRMKKDKATLKYHGKTQLEYNYELLTKYCDKVFISSRKEQDFQIEVPYIYDSFLEIGPMGGILSALKTNPKTAFLVIACDMPYVNEKTIEKLISNRDFFKYATSYINNENNFPEPLCAIYEPKIKSRLLDFLSFDITCPRKVLINSSIKGIFPENNLEMSNINTIEEFNNCIN